ncbi:hypothetical protein MMC07_001770 [Pseudocyphellaria aurata]|nr:hypothetical protein [Pseudocyphellaria aurata]
MGFLLLRQLPDLSASNFDHTEHYHIPSDDLKTTTSSHPPSPSLFWSFSMGVRIIPLFAKGICARIAAGIHSFVHPNERRELQRNECALATALADARQNEAYAHRCANRFRDRAHQSEERTQMYKERVRLEQRRRAEEVQLSGHCGFRAGYEQGHVDSAAYRDLPIYDRGLVDGYSARVKDERRQVPHWVRHGQCGHQSTGAVQPGDTSCSDELTGENSHADISRGESSHGHGSHADSSHGRTPLLERQQDYRLIGPREMNSPSRQSNPPTNRPMTVQNRRGRRNPFFPWRGDMRP